MMKRSLATACVAAASTAALASSFTMDGIREAKYGSALAVQNTPTGFGNASIGQQTFANGSELDGGYGAIVGGNLHLFITGNLETNFNKIELFFDTRAGGQNQLRGDNADVDFNGLNRMGNDGSGNGLTFDGAFSPDYYLTATAGDTGGGTFEMFANFAELLTGGGGPGGFIGGSGGNNRILNGNNGIIIGIDNSNTGGVDGGAINDPNSVTTGLEFIIPLSVLGNPVGAVGISAMINGGGHDFLSNQVLGGVGGAGNLGEPRAVNLANVPGDQFFRIIPEPTSLALLIAGLALVRRR